MSTNADIGIINPDGTVVASYLHWDGYLRRAGKILLEHYTDGTKVRKLILLGSLECLDASPDIPPPEHTFNQPAKGFCVAFCRDGWYDLKINHFSSLKSATESLDSEYTYLFDVASGTWSYRSSRTKGVFRRLTLEACKKD